MILAKPFFCFVCFLCVFICTSSFFGSPCIAIQKACIQIIIVLSLFTIKGFYEVVIIIPPWSFVIFTLLCWRSYCGEHLNGALKWPQSRVLVVLVLKCMLSLPVSWYYSARTNICCKDVNLQKCFRFLASLFCLLYICKHNDFYISLSWNS